MDIQKLQVNARKLRKELMGPNKPVLVDVREPDEYAMGIISGAIMMPLNEVPFRGPRELDRNADIVFYCAHGMRSLQALMALKAQGFEKLRSLEGGIYAWQELVDSTKA